MGDYYIIISFWDGATWQVPAVSFRMLILFPHMAKQIQDDQALKSACFWQTPADPRTEKTLKKPLRPLPQIRLHWLLKGIPPMPTPGNKAGNGGIGGGTLKNPPEN